MKRRVHEPLTAARARELFDYDPLVGHLLHRALPGKGRQKKRVGLRAGYLHPDGYWMVGADGLTYQAGRVIWLIQTGDWPIEIDHRDLDKANDRWTNLREATRRNNIANQRARGHHGLKGVKLMASGRWGARICRNGRRDCLGSYKTKEEAHAAYAAAAAETFGEFARS